MISNDTKSTALVLDSKDNVATLLTDISQDQEIILRGNSTKIRTVDSIATGHKVAISFIERGQDIISRGQRRDWQEGSDWQYRTHKA